MKHFLSGLAAFCWLASFASVTYAQSNVYLCVDASGKKEYRNVGKTKGCQLVDLPSMNSVPAPANTKKPVAKAASASSASPAGFPKVDEGTQRARDSDRKQILSDELKAEEQKLATIKKEYNNGETERRPEERLPSQYLERVNNLKSDIARTEKNIEALKREISNSK
jgi:hypothetical protein